MSTQYSD